jgi:hypothetical protein
VADTGWLNPGDVAVITVRDRAWSDPTNAFAEDGLYASAALANGKSADYLAFFGYNADLPAGSTPTGIQFRVVRYATPDGLGGIITDREVLLTFDGLSTAGSDHGDTVTPWDSSVEEKLYGGASDLWGCSPTETDINAWAFGPVLGIQSQNEAATGYVDVVQMKVDYDEAGGGSPGANSGAFFGLF